MIDRPNPRKYRSDAERRQLRALAMLGLGAALLLTPLFVPPSARQGLDVLQTAGWLLLALASLWQWRQPRQTPAALARADKADLVVHRRVRQLRHAREPLHRLPESAIGAWRQHGGG